MRLLARVWRTGRSAKPGSGMKKRKNDTRNGNASIIRTDVICLRSKIRWQNEKREWSERLLSFLCLKSGGNYKFTFAMLTSGKEVSWMAKGKYEYWLEPEGLQKIEGWARNGLTDEQIAKNMGIAYSTFRVWKGKHEALSAALKNGKEVVDLQVENALYERAIGGVRQVKKTFKVKHSYYDEQGRKCEKEELTVGVDEVYVPGDTVAQIFWLKNRKPEEWRDKVPSKDDRKEQKARIAKLKAEAAGKNPVDTGETGVVFVPPLREEIADE